MFKRSKFKKSKLSSCQSLSWILSAAEVLPPYWNNNKPAVERAISQPLANHISEVGAVSFTHERSVGSNAGMDRCYSI